MDEMIDSLWFFCGILAAILSFSQLLAKKIQSSNILFALIYLSYAVIEFEFYLRISEKLLEFPHFLAVSAPFHIVIFPCFYFYLQLLFKPDFKLTNRHFLYLLPGLLCVIILTPLLYVKSSSEKIYLIQAAYNGNIPLLILVITSCYQIYKLFFIVFIIIKTRFLWNKDKLTKYKLFRIALTLLITAKFIIALYFLSWLFHNPYIARISAVLINIIVFTPFFISSRYPGFVYHFHQEIINEKYQQSKIKGIDIDEILTKLNHFMEKEELYTDSELTINKLSLSIGISSHQLSQILNEKLQVNFRSYINQHRIEKAKHLLIYEVDKPVLDIAYDVGFNSKSSFNSIFSKMTEMTPSEFRKKNQNPQ